MDDKFDERLRERLRSLDAAVPPETRVVGVAPITRRRSAVRLVGVPSLGLAAALLIVLAAVMVAGGAPKAAGPARSEPAPTSAAPTSATQTSAAPTSASRVLGQPDVVMGSAGFPVSIDGQAVYRFEYATTWESLTGSFLVAAEAPSGAPSCPGAYPSPTPMPNAESDLFADCPEVILGYTSSSQSSGFSGTAVAPKGLPLAAISTWGGHVVVFRAHTHDPEAAQCERADLARCEAALVVESVVWPYLPSSIDGEHVYLGSDAWGGEIEKLSKSFLIGGLVGMSEGNVVSECKSSAAARELAVNCASFDTELGGAWIAPESAAELTNGWVVVVRAHFDQTLAAQCPADIRYECPQAVIVDSVVWSSNPYASNGATPTPYR